MSLRTEIIRIVNEVIARGKKITALDFAGAISGNELIEIVQDGVNKKLSVSSLASGGGIVFGGNITSAPVGPLASPTIYITTADFAWDGFDIAAGSIILGDAGATDYEDFIIR
jgi:ABC-type transport system substrate-binding protein